MKHPYLFSALLEAKAVLVDDTAYDISHIEKDGKKIFFILRENGETYFKISEEEAKTVEGWIDYHGSIVFSIKRNEESIFVIPLTSFS